MRKRNVAEWINSLEHLCKEEGYSVEIFISDAGFQVNVMDPAGGPTGDGVNRKDIDTAMQVGMERFFTFSPEWEEFFK